MILLASIFRDSTEYLERHQDQVERLRKLATEPVYCIAVEGDSNDDTYERLREMEYTDEVLKVEHGGARFGSVVHPLRWRQLSVACNAALCAAVRVMETGDRFVYVESDLVWEPDDLLALTAHLGKVHAVAPMSMALHEARFYDIWAYYRHGRHFSAHPPYYEGWTAQAQELVAIESNGSCFALDTYALPRVEFSAIDCIKGVGRSLTQNGIQLWLDPTLNVWHP